MRKIIINDHNLTKDDIELEVVRVKGLIINSRGKILLAHNNNTYQFPGGHKEDYESMEDCIKREILEETGIDLDVSEGPFLSITTYDKDYFDSGKKVLNTVYYYRFFTDLVPNFNNTHYDELELETDFNLFYVDFSTLDEFLQKEVNLGHIDKKIGREMMHVVDVYNELFGGKL